MTASVDELRQELVASDEEFRRLFEEHQQYERRLDRLQQSPTLSQEDEVEAKQIKRHKLFLKDRMEEILRAHRDNVPV